MRELKETTVLVCDARRKSREEQKKKELMEEKNMRSKKQSPEWAKFSNQFCKVVIKLSDGKDKSLKGKVSFLDREMVSITGDYTQNIIRRGDIKRITKQSGGKKWNYQKN